MRKAFRIIIAITVRTLGLSESGAPMAAALVSEEDAPLDRRTRTKNVANDLAPGDRTKFHFLDELDMKCDNAEIKTFHKVLSRRRRTSKFYPYHLRCRAVVVLAADATGKCPCLGCLSLKEKNT